MSTIHAIILAAGKATRFGTGQSKQLVPLCGMPLVRHGVAAIRALDLPIALVVGHQADQVAAAAGVDSDKLITPILQAEQRGTGHAVQCALPHVATEHILVLNGDMPLLTAEAISSLIEQHLREQNAVTFATTQLANPTGYGRVVQNPTRIIEEKECTDQEKLITTVNAGIYLFQRSFVDRAFTQLTASSTTGELYLTDLIAHAAEGAATHVLDANLVRGVNTLAELADVESVLQQRIRQQWMQQGVRLHDPASIVIDTQVHIGRGTTIGRGAHLQGSTTIGEQVTIEPYSVLRDATVYDNASVGPFAHLRGNAVVQEHAVVGNFVEIKKSTLGAHSKAKHLAYLGDATVGVRSNIGAGVVTCNYDGKKKHATTIGDSVMVGANSSLVAPIILEKNSLVAAGSTLTRDVPADALAIGRARQENKEGYSARRAGKIVIPAKPEETV